MTTPVSFIQADTSLRNAVQTMLEQGLSGLPVVSTNDTLEGILTENDIMHFIAKGPHDMDASLVKDIMNKPVECVYQDEMLYRALGRMDQRVELVVSSYGQMLLRDEADIGSSADLDAWLERETGRPTGEWVVRHGPNDMSASIASGTYPSGGMAIVPCSAKTLAGVANGTASNLIERAADVTLKERRPLVVMIREAPFNRLHLENMLRLVHDQSINEISNEAGYLGKLARRLGYDNSQTSESEGLIHDYRTVTEEIRSIFNRHLQAENTASDQ